MGISEKTLKISCGNCPEGVLSSLAIFDRARHRAVLFDEIRPDQVLKNRELFQANQYVQTLGTSACNPFAYNIWVYCIPLILCASNFDRDHQDISLPDREWLHGNLDLVTLPPGELWYIR